MNLPPAIRKLLSPLRRRLKILRLHFRKSDYAPKIFCIGYNKTGTTSMGVALRHLGYKHSTFNKIVYREYYLKKKFDKILWYTSKFESFDDLPWLKEDIIPLLNEIFPGSKFIYLHRNEADWVRSFKDYTLRKKGFKPDISLELEKYRKHNAFVNDFFADWPADRFLTLDIKDENGPEKLGEFLNVAVDFTAFPHKNKTIEFKK